MNQAIIVSGKIATLKEEKTKLLEAIARGEKSLRIAKTLPHTTGNLDKVKQAERWLTSLNNRLITVDSSLKVLEAGMRDMGDMAKTAHNAKGQSIRR